MVQRLDGARPHRTANVFNFLNKHFDDCVIALDYHTHTGSGMDCPPYLPDMNPCDFFLWEHLKNQMYRLNPEQLEQYICFAWEAIRGLHGPGPGPRPVPGPACGTENRAGR